MKDRSDGNSPRPQTFVRIPLVLQLPLQILGLLLHLFAELHRVIELLLQHFQLRLDHPECSTDSRNTHEDKYWRRGYGCNDSSRRFTYQQFPVQEAPQQNVEGSLGLTADSQHFERRGHY